MTLGYDQGDIGDLDIGNIFDYYDFLKIGQLKKKSDNFVLLI